MLNTYAIPTSLTYLSRFCIFLDYLLHPTAPPNSSRSLSHYLYIKRALHFLSWHGDLSNCTLPTPATRQLPPLVSAPCISCLRLLPFPCLFSPSFLLLACIQVHVRPWWFSCHRSLLTSVTLPIPTGVCAASWNLLVLCLFLLFLDLREDKGQGHPHYLEVARPGSCPPATFPCRRR